jgi:zinc protease
LQQNKTLIEQLKQQASYEGQQQIERELFLSDPALRTMTVAELEAVTKDQMQSIYNRYFANAQPYRLAIVGDVSAADAKSAVLATIANLPKNHPETGSRTYPAPTKPISIEFIGNGQRNAGISLLWRLPKALAKPYSFDNIQVLSRLINESLNAKIREELGLVYSLRASPRGDAYDSINVEIAVDLAADVDKRQEVIKAIQQELTEMAKRPTSQSKIDNVIKAIRDERRQRFNASGEQAKWLALNNIYVPEGEPHILEVDKQYQDITPESVNELLKLFTGNQSMPVIISSLP